MFAVPIDPEGFIHVADDGILRSYSGDGKVLDAKRLSNAALLSYAAGGPRKSEEAYTEGKDYLSTIWADVNGDDVPETQLMRPLKNFLPAPIAQPELTKLEAAKINENTSPVPVSPLEERQITVFCMGQTCTKSAACIFMGCFTCYYADHKLIGECRIV